MFSKRYIPVILAFSFLLGTGKAQTTEVPKDENKEENKGFSWDKVFVGGNFWMQFGNYTFIDISPMVGYRFTEKFSAGLGPSYQYLSIKDLGYSFSTNAYGGRVFGRYFIWQNLFTHSELELINLEAFDIQRRRVNVTNLYVGGGYRQMLGERAYADIVVLWNLNESVYSPYRNPIIRAGFNIGF